MRFSIRNINAVASADININGLTIIAGENGSGKSTVGKTIFSTIKSAATIAHGNGESRQQNIEYLADELSKALNLLRLSAPEAAYDRLPFSKSALLASIRSFDSKDSAEAYFKDLANSIDGSSPAPRIKAMIMSAIDNLAKAATATDSMDSDLAAELQRHIASEFLNSIQNYDSEESEVEFTLDDGLSAVRYGIINDAVVNASISGSGFPADATYVESPLYLHLIDILSRIPNGHNIPVPAVTVPIHIADIIEKIESMRYFYDTDQMRRNPPSSRIKDLIGGEFYYDNVRRSIMFKSGENEYYPINVASGAKSFGIIQMLLDGRYISPTRPLIWDEPENHLHPRWQVRLADMLVQLAKEGVPILVSTHSPYFIQGIRYFARKYGSESYVDYYMSEMSGSSAIVSCVTDDLNRIFYKLASPLNEIMDLPDPV